MVRKGVIVEIEREHGRSRKGGRGMKVATAPFSLWVFKKDSQKTSWNKVNREKRKYKWRDIILNFVLLMCKYTCNLPAPNYFTNSCYVFFRLGILKTYQLYKAIINRTVLYLIHYKSCIRRILLDIQILQSPFWTNLESEISFFLMNSLSRPYFLSSSHIDQISIWMQKFAFPSKCISSWGILTSMILQGVWVSIVLQTPLWPDMLEPLWVGSWQGFYWLPWLCISYTNIDISGKI